MVTVSSKSTSSSVLVDPACAVWFWSIEGKSSTRLLGPAFAMCSWLLHVIVRRQHHVFKLKSIYP